ncbi:MAG: phospholipase D-like domain-containing protein [Bacteroidota bacterium]
MKKLFLLICILHTVNVNAISIHDARRQPAGSIVSITGIVLNGNEFGNQRFIDDGTDAVCVYDLALAGVATGTEITVQGTIDNYHSLIEVITLTVMNVNSINNPLPAKPVLYPYQLKESYEGRLIQLRNVLITGAAGTFAGNTSYTVSDGQSSSVIYIRTGTNLVGQPIPTGRINVSGIGSQYDNTYELFPRTMTDIEIASLYIATNPQITNMTSSGFDVQWETNNSSTTSIRYGITPALELGILTGNAGTTHAASVSGAPASTVYYVQAVSVQGNDSAMSPVIMGITSSATPGNVNVIFNRTVNTTVASPANNIAQYIPNAFDDTIAAVINNALTSIDISIYSFTNSGTSNIINAINNAYTIGTQVRIIYDGNYPLAGIQQLNPAIPKLSSPPADFYYNIDHNKFVIADAGSSSATVITGSTNFSNGQLYDDANNMVIIRDQSMAKIYTMEFEEIWGTSAAIPDLLQSRFGYYKKDNTPHQVQVGNILMESYFSPSDNVNFVINDKLKNADYNLYFALLIFTKSDFAAQIVQKITNGILVAGIVDDTSGTGAASVYNSIHNAAGSNMQINTPTGSEILHHKYLIVDQNSSSDPLVLTGSHNWSFTAETANDENSIVIHDALIANQYYQEFYKRMQDNGVVLLSDEIKNENNMALYPVPCNDVLRIVSADKEKINFSIYNAEGRLILTSEIKGITTIDTQNFSEGVYFISSATGNVSAKFVVKH